MPNAFASREHDSLRGEASASAPKLQGADGAGADGADGLMGSGTKEGNRSEEDGGRGMSSLDLHEDFKKETILIYIIHKEKV